MCHDRMTSQERMQALMKGDRPDRVPCIPFIQGHAAVVCGKPIGKIYDNAEESFKYQMYAKDLSHICGEQNKNLKYWQQVPYGKKGILSFGPEVSLKKASELFPENIIAGNVDPVIIQEGTPEEVLEYCRRAIEEGKDHPGGYILMAGCELPPMAPPVNVSMMVKAVREYGRY